MLRAFCCPCYRMRHAVNAFWGCSCFRSLPGVACSMPLAGGNLSCSSSVLRTRERPRPPEAALCPVLMGFAPVPWDLAWALEVCLGAEQLGINSCALLGLLRFRGAGQWDGERHFSRLPQSGERAQPGGCRRSGWVCAGREAPESCFLHFLGESPQQPQKTEEQKPTQVSGASSPWQALRAAGVGCQTGFVPWNSHVC